MNYNNTFNFPQNKVVNETLYNNWDRQDIHKGIIPKDIQPNHLQLPIVNARKNFLINSNTFRDTLMPLDAYEHEKEQLIGGGRGGQSMIKPTFSNYPPHFTRDEGYEVIPNRSSKNFEYMGDGGVLDRLTGGARGSLYVPCGEKHNYPAYIPVSDYPASAGGISGGALVSNNVVLDPRFRPIGMPNPMHRHWNTQSREPIEIGGSFWSDVYEGAKSFGRNAGDVAKSFLQNPEVQRELLSLGKELFHAYKSGRGMSGGAWYDDLWRGVKDVGSFLQQNAMDTLKDPETRKALINLGVSALSHGAGFSGGSIENEYVKCQTSKAKHAHGKGLSGGAWYNDLWYGIKSVASDPAVKKVALETLSDIVKARSGAGMSGGMEGCGLSGGNAWDDIWQNVKSVAQDPEVKKVALETLSDIARSRARGGGESGGSLLGIKEAEQAQNHELMELPKHLISSAETAQFNHLIPKKDHKKKSTKRPRGERHAIVKRIMQEKGLKLIEASKYVKQHNLY